MLSCAAETNAASGRSAKRSTTPAIIARTQSSAARGRRCARSTTAPSSLRFMSSKISLDIAPSTIVEQRGDVELERAVLGAAEVERADAALVVGRRRECSPARGRSPARRSLRRRAARASARRARPCASAPSSALRGDADHPPRATAGGHRPGVERGDLLRRDAGHGRRPPLGEASGDRHLHPSRDARARARAPRRPGRAVRRACPRRRRPRRGWRRRMSTSKRGRARPRVGQAR